jgi:hypothetical protein
MVTRRSNSPQSEQIVVPFAQLTNCVGPFACCCWIFLFDPSMRIFQKSCHLRSYSGLSYCASNSLFRVARSSTALSPPENTSSLFRVLQTDVLRGSLSDRFSYKKVFGFANVHGSDFMWPAKINKSPGMARCIMRLAGEPDDHWSRTFGTGGKSGHRSASADNSSVRFADLRVMGNAPGNARGTVEAAT